MATIIFFTAFSFTTIAKAEISTISVPLQSSVVQGESVFFTLYFHNKTYEDKTLFQKKN